MTELFGGGTEDRKEVVAMLKIWSGKEEGFHYLREWFAANAAMEKGIEVIEGDRDGMDMPSERCTDNTLSPLVGSLRIRTV